MSLYLFLNIAVIIIPFLLSFERKIEFYKKWKFLIPALLIVGSVYIGWDILSLKTKVWRFNREYTSGIEILGLPVEEILFFITVPYSCIFLYESLSFYLGRRIKYANFSGKQTVIPFIILISAAAAVFFSDQPYTFTVLLSISVFFLISYFFYREFLRSKNLLDVHGTDFYTLHGSQLRTDIRSGCYL